MFRIFFNLAGIAVGLNIIGYLIQSLKEKMNEEKD